LPASVPFKNFILRFCEAVPKQNPKPQSLDTFVQLVGSDASSRMADLFVSVRQMQHPSVK
jgi:hypothetical protein